MDGTFKKWKYADINQLKEISVGDFLKIADDTMFSGEIYGHRSYDDGSIIVTYPVMIIRQSETDFLIRNARGITYGFNLDDAYEPTIKNWRILDANNEDILIVALRSETPITVTTPITIVGTADGIPGSRDGEYFIANIINRLEHADEESGDLIVTTTEGESYRLPFAEKVGFWAVDSLLDWHWEFDPFAKVEIRPTMLQVAALCVGSDYKPNRFIRKEVSIPPELDLHFCGRFNKKNFKTARISKVFSAQLSGCLETYVVIDEHRGLFFKICLEDIDEAQKEMLSCQCFKDILKNHS